MVKNLEVLFIFPKFAAEIQNNWCRAMMNILAQKLIF